jgi:hypothetical protein
MKLTTRSIKPYASEKRHLILREGVPVGLLSKLPNTRTEEHPWKLFLYVGEFVPAETEVRLVTVSYGKSFGESRRELLRIAAEELAKETVNG